MGCFSVSTRSEARVLRDVTAAVRRVGGVDAFTALSYWLSLAPPQACVPVPVSGAVVVAFVVCWLPYHVRRLMFCYISGEQWTP